RKTATAIGRVLAVNTFVLSKMWYAAQCIYVPDSFIKEIRVMIRNYIRAGRTGNVAMHTIELPKRCGGLGLIPVAYQVKAAGAVWWKRLLDPVHLPWHAVARALLPHRLQRPQLHHRWFHDLENQRGRTHILP